MALPPRNSPQRTFDLTARLALVSGVVDLATGLIGLCYCFAAMDLNPYGVNPRVVGFVFAVFGGLGIVPGMLLCNLATKVWRRRKWMFVLLVVVSGLHGALALRLWVDQLPDFRRLFRRGFTAALFDGSVLVFLGAVVLLDGWLLVYSCKSVQLANKRRPVGRAFRPVMGVLPLDDVADAGGG